MTGNIFVSHSPKDDAFVRELRNAFEAFGKLSWVDSGILCQVNYLEKTIDTGILNAAHFLAVVSMDSLDSEQVQFEIKTAQNAARRRGDDFKIISVVLPGVGKGILKPFFPTEPAFIFVEDVPTGFRDAIPGLFAALGERLPDDWEVSLEIPAEPAEELILRLSNVHIRELYGIRRATADAVLTYVPAGGSEPVTSHQYRFTAPLGPEELGVIRWYIERYYQWPTGVFKEHAAKFEGDLPLWGQALHKAVIAGESSRGSQVAWQSTTGTRRFSVHMAPEPKEGISERQAALHRETANFLFSLPWEILHDGNGFISQGQNRVLVRRRFPRLKRIISGNTNLPVRTLLLSPRPEMDEEGSDISYLDHRSSARPLLSVAENLGENLLQLDILRPPNISALKAALKTAADKGNPYHIVHFDGNGVYDSRLGRTALYFEHPDSEKPGKRLLQLVYADELAAELRFHRIPLICLNVCPSPHSNGDPNASLAATLLEQGAASVVAMGHPVPVETARHFFEPFYRTLAEGKRLGDAMLTGRAALFKDTYRFNILGKGKLNLRDWFVPLLYQEARDPVLFPLKPGRDTTSPAKKRPALQLGKLPEAPNHTFIGRSRELLHLERLLERESYIVILGSEGMGKTVLAAELLRWQVSCGLKARAAFVRVEPERVQDMQGLLDAVGKQLLPHYSAAEYGENLDAALTPIKGALRDHPTLILFDKVESVLPDSRGVKPACAVNVTELSILCQRLLAATESLETHKQSRLVFTSRECLPVPFNGEVNTMELESLSKPEAVELVEKVMAERGWEPPPEDSAETMEELEELVDTVDCHPRALIFLARELTGGVRAATRRTSRLMAELEQRYPANRENPLFAGLELALSRLPQEMRTQVDRLAVFKGGGHLANIAHVLGIKPDNVTPLVERLCDMGVAEMKEHGYLSLDPALPDYLKLGQSPAQLAECEAKWSDAVIQLVNFLHQKNSQDSAMASRLALQELPSLIALLNLLEKRFEADRSQAQKVSDTAGKIEQILKFFNLPQQLARAAALRERVAEAIKDWGEGCFHDERLQIEGLLMQGQFTSAYDKAHVLWEKSKTAGPSAYKGADFDLAAAHWLLGKTLKAMGKASQALEFFARAQVLFEALGDEEERMATAALGEQADCLLNLGRLEEVIGKNQEIVKRSGKAADFRQVAVGKIQLATVQLLREKHVEALSGYREALSIFEEQNEPATVAMVWHQIGMVHQNSGNYQGAESAYLKSLEIKTGINDRVGQARSLNQLGILYKNHLDRPEDAVAFYKKAADIAVELGDMLKEGTRRSNIANTLCYKLKRYDEARVEIMRAIECARKFGHAAEPWKSFGILYDIETASGNRDAAREARQQARDAYLAYRREGGYAQGGGGKLVENALSLVSRQKRDEAHALLRDIADDPKRPVSLKIFAQAVMAILSGSRERSLADEPKLYYRDAAELILMLENMQN